MKRVSTPSDAAPTAKRTKASQACASCRRQKSRCEILDVPRQSGSPVTVRCHRCKVLGVECSFETSDLIHFMPKPTAQAPPSPASTVSDDRHSSEHYGGLNTLAAVASSRPKSSETVNSIPSRYGMLPEDLVPTATTPVWGCTSRIDWTASPMLALQELVRCPRTDAGHDIPSGRLTDILSLDEITSLFEIFETRYSPWLSAQPGSLECKHSLLDIVRCTIASRHLDPAFRSAVAPRLQKLTEEVFLREIFNPQPSADSIKALLILSVWAPICGTGAEARDGRLLIASAVSMAMNLHLETASKRAIEIRALKGDLSAEKAEELEECTNQWRLWMLLSTSESMLCVGTGRMPVSRRSQLDADMISLSTLTSFTLPSVRDVRLGLMATLFDISESGLSLRLQSLPEFGIFYAALNDTMSTLDGLQRLLTPLPVITKHDVFHSQMLVLQYHACRLLVLHHALRELRTVHERDDPSSKWVKFQSGGQCVMLLWGRMALISSEAVLTAFVATSDSALLSTAPDNLFVMVAFAATWIFVSNFTLYQLGGNRLGGASEILQTMAIDRLNEISLAPDHAAVRCGHVLGALHNAWERRTPRTQTGSCGPCIMAMPYDEFRTRRPLYENRPVDPPAFMHTHAPVPAPPSVNPEFPHLQDFQDDGNSELFLDDTFWQSFLENLNSEGLPGVVR